MSKIMGLMYAEARAARAATANPGEDRIHDTQTRASFKLEWWTLPVRNPVESARSTLEWWTTRIAKGPQPNANGRVNAAGVAATARDTPARPRRQLPSPC
ncbi:hypothetical protein [Piscinibacter sp. XHJ-5]|uniref:hypothetical protein n=1 Tax=Piscinibacter sp. XHJ-5 TaxID=3037797 RepID=UPI0024532CC8|nr:hypothetical protein [Piscinibacter sp. XHJ-5]